MRKYTNLLWPEGPFGAELRPFGKPAPMIAAYTVDWTSERLPVAAAAVYLRVRRAGSMEVTAATMNPGLDAVAPERLTEASTVIRWLDRGLIRARREATVLAGHAFTDDLTAAQDLAGRPLAGLAGVADAWNDRDAKRRGMARMVDTGSDLNELDDIGARLSVPLGRAPGVPWPRGREDRADAALTCLIRCLAIGLAASAHVEAYHWDGMLDVPMAVIHAAWDEFPHRERTSVG